MIPAYEITKRLFIWGVVTVAVMPRQHIDRRGGWWWKIGGGDLSYPFRRLLLSIAGINLARLVLKESRILMKFRVVCDALGIVQQFGCSFLCFLTPYILQTWLVPFINVPGGRPGASLMRPLYLSTSLSILSVVLVRTSHPNFWFLRKLGNAVSGPPVLHTLAMFNAVTTRGGRHDGRGSIVSQSLRATECWFLATQLLCAVGFAFNDHGKDEKDYGQWDQLLGAFREIAFVSEWTRILVHALFVNQLDELYLTSPSPSSTDAGDNEEGGTSGVEPRPSGNPEIVSLVRSRQTS